jgi:hypothetical protein
MPGLKPSPRQGKHALKGMREYENTKAAHISSFYFTLQFTNKTNMPSENTYYQHKQASRRKEKHISIAETLFAQDFLQSM